MAETIITSETPSSSSQMNPSSSSHIICRVCQKQFSQYTCPRCNSRYCSLNCYKSHSLYCTESFMRENVVEELQRLQPDDGTKQKMLDILKRFHSEEEMDIMNEDGDQLNYDDLSAEQKKRLQRALISGELSKFIEPWDPWWLKPSARTISLSLDGTQLVQPLIKQETVISKQDDTGSQSRDIPPGPEIPLPPVSKLSSTEPSPLLAIHLVDMIYSYCFTLRLYNGDWLSDAIGSAMVILSISTVLGLGGQPETVMEAMSYCLEQTCSPDYRHMGGLQFGLGLLDDVVSLLYLGGCALVCLLCDLQRLIQAAERELKLEKPRKSKRVEIRSKLKLAERKTFFMMCWVHEQPAAAWASLGAIIKAEKGSAMDYGGNKGGALKMENKTSMSKVMIEEI
ncbi:uncharacterized protein LOC132308171 isoform X2 [Cornus florida]|uniref:uncharacterized protein LOC132308171 isoform X2 n=1 Tax=Cornus florida TaxID=4283 RepID=UPI00289F7423|nr:uncharacterized protein LOC132308171 isoform X2 [Cornus florida]